MTLKQDASLIDCGFLGLSELICHHICVCNELCTVHICMFEDEAMSIWFDGGNGYVFASVSEWLHGSNGQLLQSAAFAIGNFARHGESVQ